MAPSLPYIPLFDPRRLRSYLLRLPLFTRIAFFFVVVFWLLGFQSIWNIVQWGALIPKEINLGTSMLRGKKAAPKLPGFTQRETPANPAAYHSVPFKHLSSHPPKLPQRRLQRPSACSPSRAVRKRAWHTVDGGHVCRTYVFFPPTSGRQDPY